MTDYNDGRWHGWNGGECPVHPKTDTEYMTRNGINYTRPAGHISWESGFDSSVIAFRVVKEHREPREVYLNEWRQYNLLNGKAGEKNVWGECSPDDKGAVLFREVIE